MQILRTFDRVTLRPLREITKPNNLSVSYVLMKARQATFDIAYNHPAATAEILAKGNILVIYSDELPTWVGYIVKLHWNGPVLTVTAFDILQRLQKRWCRPGRISGKPPGTHFAHLINEANSRQSTNIYLGNVTSAGPNLTLDYNLETTYDKLLSLVDQVQYEFRVYPTTPDRQPDKYYHIDLAQKIGNDQTQVVVVIAGLDTVDNPEYEEDDTPYFNDITAAGKRPSSGGSNQSPDVEWDKRPKGHWTDAVEIGLKGLAETVIDKTDMTDRAALTAAARQQGHLSESPPAPVTLHLNNRRRLWKLFREGDYICLSMPHYAFTGLSVPLRVLGMEYDGQSDSLVITANTVSGDEAQTLRMYKSGQWGTERGKAHDTSYDGDGYRSEYGGRGIIFGGG